MSTPSTGLEGVSSSTGTPRCGCCGRSGRRMHELGDTPGVYICIGCALWAARRAAGLPSPSSRLPRVLLQSVRARLVLIRGRH